MITCSKCSSNRVASISAKCSDLCFVHIQGEEHDGYVPDDMGIGGGDYVEIDLCLNCGTVQGEWPLPECELEQPESSPSHSEFVPAPRDPRYTEYLDALIKVCQRYSHMGINAILPTLLGEDYDPDRIIAGVQEIFRHEQFRALGDTILDKMQEWEHYDRMRQAVKLVVPPQQEEYD